MFRNLKQMGRWMAIAVAIGLLCSAGALAKKPDKPPGGGGDSPTPSGVVYYWHTQDVIAMDADGANKTVAATGIGSAVPSIAKHDDMRWFLHGGYPDLNATSDANTTVTLYTVPDGVSISQMRWGSHPIAGKDAFVSWYESVAGVEEGVLVRAPVVYGDEGEITGLDLSLVECFSGTSLDYDWSPDGTAVVYRNENELWIYDTLSDKHAPLPATIGAEPQWTQPRWSPDGTRIVYGASADTWTSIETIDLSDLSITVVAKAKHHGINGKYVDRPIWSPDGNFILYRYLDAAAYDWEYDIMRCTPDGGNPTNLTRDVTISFYASWLTILGWCLD